MRDLSDYGCATQAGREIGLILAEGLISDLEAIEALGEQLAKLKADLDNQLAACERQL